MTEIIKNVVKYETENRITYPSWSDYGCLTSFACITYKGEDGDYHIVSKQLEDVPEWGNKDDFEIQMASEDEIQKYYEWRFQNRMKESQDEKTSAYAEPGDIIEVYKGRKLPKGTKITVKKEYQYKDQYDRIQACYWIGTKGEFINQANCIIVGHEGQLTK